jgi:hypothetical protein
VNNWKNITNSPKSVRKKSFGGTFCFSNCHIIRLDTGGLVFLVSATDIVAFCFGISENIVFSNAIDNCVVHLQDKATPSTKALWPGASFQNRSY